MFFRVGLCNAVCTTPEAPEPNIFAFLKSKSSKVDKKDPNFAVPFSSFTNELFERDVFKL